MTRSRRWGVLLALVALLVALPLAVAAFPVGGTATPAAALLARIRASTTSPYAGYAESTGALALPASDTLDAVSGLLGGRTQVRVWWRSATDWRADTLGPTGEESTHATASGLEQWDYEDRRVTSTPADVDGAVRLPRATDALPPVLAARLLSEATSAQVTALPSRRVAGRASDGMRLSPADALSSIDHVDVWADRSSGIPVTVEVYGRTAGVAAMSTTFLDFTPASPSAAETAFTAPLGARVRLGQRFDLVRAIGRVSDSGLPATLLGFPRAPAQSGLEGIGQYGRGVTQFAVGTLPDRVAGSLREQLMIAAGARQLPEGIAVAVGPLALLLTDPKVTGRTLLVTGTLTPDGLARAATELRTS